MKIKHMLILLFVLVISAISVSAYGVDNVVQVPIIGEGGDILIPSSYSALMPNWI